VSVWQPALVCLYVKGVSDVDLFVQLRGSHWVTKVLLDRYQARPGRNVSLCLRCGRYVLWIASPSIYSASNRDNSNIPASRYSTARGKPKIKFQVLPEDHYGVVGHLVNNLLTFVVDHVENARNTNC
jgi:hypothetical protein